MRLRTHRFTKVVCVGLLLSLVLIMVPGDVVWEDPGVGPSLSISVYEHGWPFVHLARARKFARLDFADRPQWGIPWLAWDSWTFWESDNRDFHLQELCGNLSVAAMILFGVGALVEAWRRRRPSVWRFRLVDVFVALTVLLLALGWCTHVWREHGREHVHNEALWEDGHFCYDRNVVPLWLRRLVGEQLLPQQFWRTVCVQLSGHDSYSVEEMMKHLSELRHLEMLEIVSARADNVPYSQLRRLHRLRNLVLYDAVLTDYDVFDLTALDQLQVLSLLNWEEQDPRILQKLVGALRHCKITDGIYWSEVLQGGTARHWLH